jgi:hypothetical protein
MLPIRDLWKHLCERTHATRSAQQIGLDLRFADDAKGLAETFVLLEAMLECNYVFLNRHLVNPTLIYYAKRYSKDYEVPELKRKIDELRVNAHKSFGSETRKVIRCYRLTWKIK